jgi:hypothetical protein
MTDDGVRVSQSSALSTMSLVHQKVTGASVDVNVVTIDKSVTFIHATHT